jgi:hypothetical protein
MGRVDHGVDALGLEVGRKALGAAKAADSLRDRRGRGVRGRAGERQDRRDPGFIGETAREPACFRRSAENEQAKALQGEAP